MEKRACLRCEGSKVVTSKGFTALNGKVFPDVTRPCTCCNGVGEYPEVDENAIMEALIATRGKNKGQIRAAMSSPVNGSIQDERAYYVWRMARFHSGKDTTMPMTANMITRGDPFRKELDALADKVADVYFGNNILGAARWAKAFGLI